MALPELHELIYKRPYTGAGAPKETPEFIIFVNPEKLNKWKHDPHEVALTEVVDTFEVFIAHDRYHSGKLEHPSNSVLEDAFGSHKFEDIFDYMAKNGHVATAQHRDIRGRAKGYRDEPH